MEDASTSRVADWKAAHGAILLVAFLTLQWLPERWMYWPAPLLFPLLLYGVFVILIPSLRNSCVWMRVGRFTWPIVLATVIVSIVSCLALVLYQVTQSPNLQHLDAGLPLGLYGGTVLTGLIFVLLNPVIEEVIFRGVLLQAIKAHTSWPVALVASSIVFGLGHVGGYPPGAVGGVLAGIYGLALGLLLRYSGGLLAPVIAHMCADATILGIRIVSSGM